MTTKPNTACTRSPEEHRIEQPEQDTPGHMVGRFAGAFSGSFIGFKVVPPALIRVLTRRVPRRRHAGQVASRCVCVTNPTGNVDGLLLPFMIIFVLYIDLQKCKQDLSK